MLYKGTLRKMQTEWAEPIHYFLRMESATLHLNQALGKRLSVEHVGFQCLCCELEKKIFRQGFCYDCFYSSPKAGDWIMRPELSTAHLDKADRDLEYEKAMQLQPHIVYLAISSNVKVGVTRKTQVPTRWIDQGVHQALAILEVPNRYLAGIAEVALKAHVSDKTNWRNMLKNQFEAEDLELYRQKLEGFLPEEVKPYFLDTTQPETLDFPVHKYPETPKSLNLDKTPNYQGVLKGIKGQYLIFEDNTVFNVRANEGYVVALDILPNKSAS